MKVHDNELVNVAVGAQFLQSFPADLIVGNVGAKLHPRVQIEEQLVFSEDRVSRHQDRRRLYLMLTLDL